MSDTTEIPKGTFFVSCDLCVDVKTRALKTCLKCEISMCSQHLEPHLSTPVLLQTHPLSDPRSAASNAYMASKCSAHGKLVEYYCLDDRVLACMSCAIEEGHRLHKMKTLQTAHMELVDQLKEELKTVDQRQNQAKNLEMWHENQIQTLGRFLSQLRETGLALKDLVFTSLQTSVSSRLGALQKAKEAISSALEEEEHFNFLQNFASVHKAIEHARIVDLKQGLESEADRSKLIKEIRKEGQIIEEQVRKLHRCFLAFVDPEFHSFIEVEPKTVLELNFDPRTIGPGMSLSKDLKTVFCNLFATNQDYPSFQHRTQTVRCIQINESGILRWFLSLSEDFDWTVGLCDTNARDGNYSEVYGLKKQNNRFLSLQTQYVTQSMSNLKSMKRRCNETLPVSDKFHVNGPWKVEVIWDCTSKLLAFYSRNKPGKGLLLCKLKVNGFSLCPFITSENKTTASQNREHGGSYSRIQGRNPTGISFTEIMCVLK